MKPGVEPDLQDIFVQMPEDPAKSQKDNPSIRRKRKTYDSGSAGKFVLLAGVGLAILVLLTVLIFRGNSQEDITLLQSRLDQVENKLALLDDKARKVEALEDQMKFLQQGQTGLEASGKSIGERLDRLAEEVKKVATLPGAPTSAGEPRMQVHQVRRGDTLLGIAVQYGITLDQLLRFNNLERTAVIHPGQTLLISPRRP